MSCRELDQLTGPDVEEGINTDKQRGVREPAQRLYLPSAARRAVLGGAALPGLPAVALSAVPVSHSLVG